MALQQEPSSSFLCISCLKSPHPPWLSLTDDKIPESRLSALEGTVAPDTTLGKKKFNILICQKTVNSGQHIEAKHPAK